MLLRLCRFYCGGFGLNFKLIVHYVCRSSFLFLCTTIFTFKMSSLCTEQKMKFFIKDFSSKCDQIRRKLWIWSHFLKKSLKENFIFCAVLFLLPTTILLIIVSSLHCCFYQPLVTTRKISLH